MGGKGGEITNASVCAVYMWGGGGGGLNQAGGEGGGGEVLVFVGLPVDVDCGFKREELHGGKKKKKAFLSFHVRGLLPSPALFGRDSGLIQRVSYWLVRVENGEPHLHGAHSPSDHGLLELCIIVLYVLYSTCMSFIVSARDPVPVRSKILGDGPNSANEQTNTCYARDIQYNTCFPNHFRPISEGELVHISTSASPHSHPPPRSRVTALRRRRRATVRNPPVFCSALLCVHAVSLANAHGPQGVPADACQESSLRRATPPPQLLLSR